MMNDVRGECMPDISVVVPVYKVEKTLDRCVQSLLQQEIENYEILLIDDGSPDNSGKMCDAYAQSEERIRVIHKENGGLGSARNCGIEHAEGKYICFVDSDDYVEKGYLKNMYDAAVKSECDIVISGYRLKREDSISDYSPSIAEGLYQNKDYYELILEYAKGNSIFYFAWNKFYRRSTIIQNELKYIDRHCAEDMMFNAQFYAVAGSVFMIHSTDYVYTMENPNSLSNRRRPGFWNDMKLVAQAYRGIYRDKLEFSNKQAVIDNIILVLLRNTISNYLTNESFEPKEAIGFIGTCCEEKIVTEALVHIQPQGKFDKIFLSLINGKHYLSMAYLVRFKAFIKWKMMRLFDFLRKRI